MGEVTNEVRRLETLIEINALINSQYRDVRVLLSRIMESAERLIGSEASSLLLVDLGKKQLYFEIALGDKGADVEKYTLEMGEGIAGWVAVNNRSLIINDAENDPRHFSLIGEDTGYKTNNLIAVPLRAKDEVIGVLEVINKSDGNTFNDEDLRFLEVLADQASIAIQNARDFGQLSNELDRLKTGVILNPHFKQQEFISKSSITRNLLEQVDKIALSDSSVLILGESGTGKELLADRIHYKSNRKSGPLIKVNCAAIPSDLIESELFGYEKGAFTDAYRDKTGLFDRANGGTLFLDEIAELSISAQGKLLRVLQNGVFHRVGGGGADINVDVRVIAATNKNPEELVNGTFRQELYYRLAVLPIEIPPLRERVEDIEVLARFFLNEFKSGHNDVASDFSLEALDVLLSYHWPGNVRELQNAVERAVINSHDKHEITPEDLALPCQTRRSIDYKGKNLKDSLALFKKNFVREVLINHDGNQTFTADALGIQRTYLSRLIKKLNIVVTKEMKDK